MMFDVIALTKINDLKYGSGDYRTLIVMETGSELPNTDLVGYVWIRIGYNITLDEAEKIMSQYPTATRARSEVCVIEEYVFED